MSSFTNLSTPLDPGADQHLSPGNGKGFEAGRHVILVVLGMTIWDTLIYIRDDWRILRHSPLQCVVLCFVFSRLFALCYIILDVLRTTVPFCNPRVPPIITTLLGILAIACSTFLFLRRLHAVYSDQRRIRWLFSALWALYVTAEFAVPFGILPTYITGTQNLHNTDAKSYFGIVGTLLLIYDTSVFLAISIKVATSHSPADEKIKWNTIVSGKALPRLSRAILQGGQQYYLMTTVTTTLLTVTVFLPTVPLPFQMSLMASVVPFTASMASRAYRNLWLLKLESATGNIGCPGTITDIQSGHPTTIFPTRGENSC